MRLDGRLFLLFLVVSTAFACVLASSSRRAVHATLVANLEAPARAREREVARSMAVGLRPGSERILADYLKGCVSSFGASYAAALGPGGVVLASESSGVAGPAAGTRLEGGEGTEDGRPTLRLVLPAASGGGALALGFDLSEILESEKDIALKMFLYASSSCVLALVLLFLMMRALVKRFDRMSADILRHMHDGVFVVGADGKVRAVNPALTRMLGYSEYELVGRPASSLLEPGASLGGDSGNSKLRLVRKDGGTVPVLLSASLLRAGDESADGIVCAVRDVTEVERKDELLRRADKLSAVGRLAAGIAHEINNPLGSMLGFAQAALARDDSGPLAEALRAIEEEALRCRNLVKSLLAFSRESKGAAEEFELAAAVDGTLAVIEAQAKTRGVVIARSLESGRRAVGDRGQIQQVVMNLCTNAMDAMPDGGTMTVRCGRSDGGVFIEVEDQGSGVPEAIRGRIFDPFFTTKDVGQGTGLGLSLVHEIALRHRGTVTAGSAPGGGALFRVEWPSS